MAYLRRLVVAAVLTMLFALTACSHIGPGTMQRDRLDYVNATVESWKQQTLLNIVKLRYADTPMFLEVGQIISGYQLESAASISTDLYDLSSQADIIHLGASGRYTDRPTITYTPATGSHFIRVMMTPIPPPALLAIIDSGWPVDTLMQIGVQSINGLSNRRGGALGRPADPEFAELLSALRRIQNSGAMSIRIEPSGESKQEGMIMAVNKDRSPEVKADSELVRELLGLSPELIEFKIVYGDVGNEDTIAIRTRSGFQIMAQLGSEVEVPAEHVKEHRTYAMAAVPENGASSLPPILLIHSGTSKPSDSFVEVKYRGYWYWINDTEYRSKGAFSFLMVLLTLAEKDEKVAQPVVTIQGN